MSHVDKPVSESRVPNLLGGGVDYEEEHWYKTTAAGDVLVGVRSGFDGGVFLSRPNRLQGAGKRMTSSAGGRQGEPHRESWRLVGLS